MADLSKLQKRRHLPDPPPAAAATRNLQAPEIAPILRDQSADVSSFAHIDGRSLRATHRTHQFATRIKEETHNRMKMIAARDRITLGELMERAVESYERERASR
jgi:hypothetical protein